MPAFVRGRARRGAAGRWRDRLALLRTAAGWAPRGFRCAPRPPSPSWRRGLPEAVRRELIEPLCVAALNTPADAASGSVFLRVLRDALFAGAGRVRPAAAAPRPGRPAAAAGAALARRPPARGSGSRTGSSDRSRRGGGQRLAGRRRGLRRASCSPPARSRRRAWSRRTTPAWAARAAALRYEPIVTVYARSAGARLPEPMLALRSDDRPPGAVRLRPRPARRPGRPARLRRQRRRGLGRARPRRHRGGDAGPGARRSWPRTCAGPLAALRTIVEKRATFRCTPLLRPAAGAVAPGLAAAGDYVDGPYPATLEGAVRSGTAAARSLLSRADARRELAPCERPKTGPSPSRCWSAPSRCSTCWPRTRSRCR